MKLFKYKNYEDYVKAQSEGIYNHPSGGYSVDYEWVHRSEIDYLWNVVIQPYFQSLKKVPKYGICHGAKLGKENVWFEDASGVDFVGTDLILPNNSDMKLINWDFHKIKESWEDKFDIIYSNALDHAYDPEMALSNWLRTLSDAGLCILEHTIWHEECTHVDPFGATLEEYKTLTVKCGGTVIGELEYYSRQIGTKKSFLVIRKTNKEIKDGS